jgi:hypothetical protein
MYGISLRMLRDIDEVTDTSGTVVDLIPGESKQTMLLTNGLIEDIPLDELEAVEVKDLPKHLVNQLVFAYQLYKVMVDVARGKSEVTEYKFSELRRRKNNVSFSAQSLNTARIGYDVEFKIDVLECNQSAIDCYLERMGRLT